VLSLGALAPPTLDLDLVVQLERDNVERALSALAELGFSPRRPCRSGPSPIRRSAPPGEAGSRSLVNTSSMDRSFVMIVFPLSSFRQIAASQPKAAANSDIAAAISGNTPVLKTSSLFAQGRKGSAD